MKKVICLMIALLVCISLACPAFAASEFVPSITAKDAPEVVVVKDKDGKEAAGTVVNEAGEVVSYVPTTALLITPVSAATTDTAAPAEITKQLNEIYEALSNGTMKIPYPETVKAENMVVRDLIDVSFVEEDQASAIDPEGVALTLTFDLGVEKDDVVIVMTYKNNAWNEIAKVVNNGDGTVTCTFEHLCPVSFSVEKKAAPDSPSTGDELGGDLLLWGGLMVASAAAVVVVIASRRKVQN